MKNTPVLEEEENYRSIVKECLDEKLESVIDQIMEEMKDRIMKLGVPCWIEKRLNKTKMIYLICTEVWMFKKTDATS